MTDNLFLITGCSGGGKTTLVKALDAMGHATVPEPGMRVVAAETAGDGDALPWVDMRSFAQRCLSLAQADFRNAPQIPHPVFFDRGVVDAAVALDHSGGPSFRDTLGKGRAYASTVFVAPPWSEIFESAAFRRHDFDSAVREYDRITRVLTELGYAQVELPRAPIAERIDFIRTTLKLD